MTFARIHSVSCARHTTAESRGELRVLHGFYSASGFDSDMAVTGLAASCGLGWGGQATKERSNRKLCHLSWRAVREELQAGGPDESYELKPASAPSHLMAAQWCLRGVGSVGGAQLTCAPRGLGREGLARREGFPGHMEWPNLSEQEWPVLACLRFGPHAWA